MSLFYINNVLKNDVFSFNCLNKKNSETSEVIFLEFKAGPLPPKTKSRVSDAFSQNIKTVSNWWKKKKPASSVDLPACVISPLHYLLHSDFEAEDTGSKTAQGRGRTSRSRCKQAKSWRYFTQRIEGIP